MIRKMSFQLRGFRAILCVALLLAASACGSSDSDAAPASVGKNWNEVLKKADAEGSVMIYTNFTNEQSSALRTAFEKRYPKITLKPVRIVGSDMYQKLEAERKTGASGADVATTADFGWGASQLKDDPNRLHAIVGPEAKKLDPKYVAGDGKMATIYLGLLDFAWNTKLLPEGITSAQDLLKPALKGKIGLQDIRSPFQAALYMHFESAYGNGFLEKLAAQKPTIYPGTVPMAQALGVGEIAVTLEPPATMSELKEKGAPIAWSGPNESEKGYAYSSVQQIMGWAKHPNAAQVLVNFLTTPEGQAPVVKGNATTLNVPVPGAASNADRYDVFDGSMSPAEFAAFDKKWRSLFVK